MNIKKILGAFIAVTVVAFSGAVVSAQTDSATPDVSVRNLSVSQSSYNSGEVVKGTFTVLNVKNSPVSNVEYIASLVGTYNENGLAGSNYDTVKLGTVALGPNESKNISFTYTLPVGLAGKDFGIQIQAKLPSGTPLGWADAPIEIVGTNSYLTLSRASISIGDAIYGPNAGPVVPKDQTVELNARLQNDTDKVANVHAIVTVYSRAIEGTPLATLPDVVTIVPANNSKSLSVTLPTFDGKPGVYVGSVSFMNDAKTKIANEITFRYIVEGQIATINSITSDTQKVSSGATVKVLISYGGTPYNIDSREFPNNASSTIAINLFNERNALVGTYSGAYNFDFGDSATFPIAITAAAKALRVEAMITASDGKQLATYTGNISADYDVIKNAHTTHEKRTAPALILAFFGVIAAIFLIRYLKRKGMKNNRAWMIALFIGIGALSFFPHTAYMFSTPISDFWGTGGNNTFSFSGVSIAIKLDPNSNNLTNVSSVAPGQKYYLRGNVTAPACSNSLQQLNFLTVSPVISTTNPTGSTALSCSGATNFCAAPQPPAAKGYVATGAINNWGTTTPNSYTPNGNETYTNNTGQFALGPMTAPTTVGSYKVYLRVNDYWANNHNYIGEVRQGQGDFAGWSIGYQDLVVASPGSARIEVVGSDGTTATAPADSRVQFSRRGTWDGNPTFYQNITTGVGYDFWAKNPGAQYTKTVGVCTYSGTGNCTPTTFSPAVCNTTQCEANGVMVNNATNKGTKVVFKYVLSSSPITGSCSASSPVGLNTPATWTATISGGTGPYSYTWSGSDGLSATTNNSASQTNSVQKSYSTSGTKTAAVLITPASGTSKTINCSNLTVSAPAVPTVTLNANPTSVNANGSTQLIWTTGGNPTSCTASNGAGTWAGSKSVSGGSETSAALTSATTFTIVCSNAGGSSAPASVTVTINDAPITTTIACYPTNPSNNHVITQAPKDLPVKWVVTQQGHTPPDRGTVPSGTYTWTDSDGEMDGSTGAQVLKYYSTTGVKDAFVSHDGASPVRCQTDGFTISAIGSYKEF